MFVKSYYLKRFVQVIEQFMQVFKPEVETYRFCKIVIDQLSTIKC